MLLGQRVPVTINAVQEHNAPMENVEEMDPPVPLRASTLDTTADLQLNVRRITAPTRSVAKTQCPVDVPEMNSVILEVAVRMVFAVERERHALLTISVPI